MSSIENKNTYQTWDNSYLLNIPMIDKQHMKFFTLFDMLFTLNKDVDKYFQILEVIEELEKYSLNHFKTEEALMRKANVPDYELHIGQHELFIKKVEDFKVAYSYENSLLLEQMVTFMRKWFLMHISEVDRKYVDSVQQYILKEALEEVQE